jgi:hypothetical protein
MEAARIPIVADDPIADQHLRIMVESMLRAGRSEREIVAAVEEAMSTHDDAKPTAVERLARLAARAVGRRS